MAQPYVGEIRMFGGNFAPAGWALCDGSIMPISENEALFYLIGTTYGGDGEETFALPDLRGRVPIHRAAAYTIGQAEGVEHVTLSVDQIPAHTHPLQASTAFANRTAPAGKVTGQLSVVGQMLYTEDEASDPLADGMSTPAGGSQPHTNMQPYLCVSFIISLYGIYPQPS